MVRFGGVDKAEVQEVAGQEPLPEFAGNTLTERFVKCVIDLYAVRRDEGDATGCTYFLLSASILSDTEGKVYSEVPLLRHGNDSISGRIWLTNANIGTAYQLPNIHTEISEAFGTIKSEGFEAAPLLVIDCRGAVCRASIYANGCIDTDNVANIDLSDGPIAVGQLTESLNQFYETIRTPLSLSEAGNEFVWKDAAAGVPVERPEKAIQRRLVGHFKASLARYTIRSEVTNSTGRADVQLIRRVVEANQNVLLDVMWTLELKVTTDVTSSGVPKTVDLESQLTDGVHQAIAYRISDDATHAGLCCFDMRKAPSTTEEYFASVCEIANDNNIFLWQGFLHRNSASLRRTVVEKKASG